jgi:DNA-binding response OmpR family regulator
MDKIMIIEDDYSLSRMISEHLERYGFNVINIKDFKNVEEIFLKEEPHLVLLDINLPYYDGFYLCKSFRRKSNVPIIIVSSRDTEMEQIAGIELGADDYITKPFSCELLLAKIRALLRRTRDDRSAKKLEVKSLILDLESFRLSYGKGSLDLSKNEFKLEKKTGHLLAVFMLLHIHSHHDIL